MDPIPKPVSISAQPTYWAVGSGQSLSDEFAYGSGQIDPHKAKDPGLVYDTSLEDYQKIKSFVVIVGGKIKTPLHQRVCIWYGLMVITKPVVQLWCIRGMQPLLVLVEESQHNHQCFVKAM